MLNVLKNNVSEMWTCEGGGERCVKNIKGVGPDGCPLIGCAVK